MRTNSDTETGAGLPAATAMGAVHLAVTEGPRALEFYRDAVGLTPLTSTEQRIGLGTPERELVVLHPGASGPVVSQHPGLYHLALLVPSRKELARAIARLFAQHISNSPTDHTMTKSDYLWDPDGNGIEIYCESPEDGAFVFEGGTFAARDNEGHPRSGRDPIDLERLFQELTAEDRLDAALPGDTKMGHVHLHIRDVDEAVRFYRDLVGFDVMGLVPQMGLAFVSAGGYHHHLGLNEWAGRGIPPAPPDTAGLRHFTIEVPRGSELLDIVGRLRGAGIAVEERDDGYLVADPSSNAMLLRSRDNRLG